MEWVALSAGRCGSECVEYSRKYTEDVVDYYKQALASNDPYIKYISFYHVMEYFFDEVFKRKLVTDLRNKIRRQNL